MNGGIWDSEGKITNIIHTFSGIVCYNIIARVEAPAFICGKGVTE